MHKRTQFYELQNILQYVIFYIIKTIAVVDICIKTLLVKKNRNIFAIFLCCCLYKLMLELEQGWPNGGSLSLCVRLFVYVPCCFFHTITTVSIFIVWKANGFYARGSVIAFKIAPPSKGSGSYNFMHSKQYKFCKISDWICTVK